MGNTIYWFSGTGNSLYAAKGLAELLEEKGLALRYGVGLKMPANYILKYDPATLGAKSDKKILNKLRKTDNKLRKIADEITGGIHKVKVNSITKKTLYTDIASLDSAFSVTEKCTGCGLCAQICPVSNIELKNKKPTWLHHCEHCVACISWCPAGAIEYGQGTQKRTRYHNPLVKPTELEIL